MIRPLIKQLYVPPIDNRGSLPPPAPITQFLPLKKFFEASGRSKILELYKFITGEINAKTYSGEIHIWNEKTVNKLKERFMSSREDREEIIKDIINSSKHELYTVVDTAILGGFDAFRAMRKDFTKGLSDNVNSEQETLSDNVIQTLRTHNDVEMLAKIVAALIYSQAKDKEATDRPSDPNERFGYKLCDFLIEVGGAKLAQAIDSYDDTPDAWRKGLARSKESVDPLPYGDFKAVLAQSVREVQNTDLYVALGKDEVKIGDSIGTGAYLDTRELIVKNPYRAKYQAIDPDLKDSDRFVVQVIKPGAIERARKAYEFVLELLDKMKRGSKVGSIGVAALIPIISHYLEMLPEETQLNHAKAIGKSMAASELFETKSLDLKNNIPITSLLSCKRDEAKVSFATAKVYEAGVSYRISKKMEGVHFDNMPTETIDDLFAKFFTAVSIFTVQLYSILTGGMYDHDRHGANQRILVDPNGKSIKIGVFDELGICDSPKNDEEKKLFANMLMDAVGCSMLRDISLDITIKEAYTKLSEKMQAGEINRSLAKTVNGMLKTLVSATDYQKFIDRFYVYLEKKSTGARLAAAAAKRFLGERALKEIAGSAYEDVLKAIVVTGKVDPVIAKVIDYRHKGIKTLLEKKHRVRKILLENNGKTQTERYAEIEAKSYGSGEANAEARRIRHYPIDVNGGKEYEFWGKEQRKVFDRLATQIPAGVGSKYYSLKVSA